MPVRTYSSGCTCGSGSRWRRTFRRTSCCSTRCSRSATRPSSGSASARSSSSRAAAARSSSSPTRRAAVESLCERALLLRHGRLELDGSTRDAIARYQALLAEEATRRSAAPACRSGGAAGAGHRRRASRTMPGEPRRQYLAGEPLVVTLAVEVDPGCRRRRSRSSCTSPAAGWSPASTQQLADLGWLGRRRRADALRARLAAARRRPLRRRGLARGHRASPPVPPLARARRPSSCYSVRGVDRGIVRLDGRWSLAGDATRGVGA